MLKIYANALLMVLFVLICIMFRNIIKHLLYTLIESIHVLTKHIKYSLNTFNVHSEPYYTQIYLYYLYHQMILYNEMMLV